jgi:tetratricopeptide (TPR) repeat protein
MTTPPRILRRLGAAAALACILGALHPGHLEAQGAAGLVAQSRRALDAGNVDEALALLGKAVAADPKDASALAWLGSAQVKKARTVELFERAGWVNRGFTTLDEAVERFPDAFVVYVVRGITAAQVPDFFRKAAVAVQDLSTVVAMRTKNAAAVPDAVMPAVYLHLGLAYKSTGRTDEARAAWEKGRSLYPSAPEAQAIDKALGSL